jgi:hypothetical protein
MRLGLIVACTTVLGTIVGLVLAIRTPSSYQGWARIRHPDHAAHPPVISPLRADLVTRELDLENRWATPFDQAAATVSSATALKPEPLGVVIVVTLPDPKDAQRVARAIAEQLGTPAHEAALASQWPRLGTLGEAGRNDLATLSQLESLLTDQARAAGFPGHGAVLKQAAAGDAKAAELARQEDFSRRWTMVRGLAAKIGFPDPEGSALARAAATIEIGPIAHMPSGQAGKTVLEAGRFGGLAVGGLIVLALMRWKPDFMRPVRTGPERPPSARPVAPEPDDPW